MLQHRTKTKTPVAELDLRTPLAGDAATVADADLEYSQYMRTQITGQRSDNVNEDYNPPEPGTDVEGGRVNIDRTSTNS